MLDNFTGFFCFLLLVTPSSGRNEYTDRKYYKTEMGLTEVPSDIPEEALEIYLQGNALVTIREFVFKNLTQTKILDISANAVRNIDVRAFTGLESLKILKMSHTDLIRLKSWSLLGLYSLEELYLDHSNIHYFSQIEPNTFSDLGNLKLLDFDGNEHYTSYLKYNTFHRLVSLQELRLNRGSITKVEPGAFLGLKSLKHLMLNYNDLTDLDENSFLGLDSIETIELSSNKLTTFSQSAFLSLPRPLSILIYANSLVCDWSMCWLKYENENNSITWTNGISPECDVIDGFPLKKWDSLDWNCTNVEMPEIPPLRDIDDRDKSSDTRVTPSGGSDGGQETQAIEGAKSDAKWIAVASVTSFLVGVMVTVAVVVVWLRRGPLRKIPKHPLDAGYLNPVGPPSGDETESINRPLPPVVPVPLPPVNQSHPVPFPVTRPLSLLPSGEENVYSMPDEDNRSETTVYEDTRRNLTVNEHNRSNTTSDGYCRPLPSVK